MAKTAKHYWIVAALLLATSPAHAGPCSQTIASIQSEVDANIEMRATSDGWNIESFNTLRSYQRTPRSLTPAEGGYEQLIEYALDSLDRARAADRAGDAAACRQELFIAQAVLRQ